VSTKAAPKLFGAAVNGYPSTALRQAFTKPALRWTKDDELKTVNGAPEPRGARA